LRSELSSALVALADKLRAVEDGVLRVPDRGRADERSPEDAAYRVCLEIGTGMVKMRDSERSAKWT
jgi:hypothetical protein